MVQKIDSLEDTISYLEQESPMENDKIKKLSIKNSSLHKAK